MSETPNLNYIYKNKSYKPFFANNEAYTNGNNLAKRTTSHKFLKDRTYEIAINPKYNGYWRRLASNILANLLWYPLYLGFISVSIYDLQVSKIKLTKPYVRKIESGLNVNEVLA